MNTPGGSWVGVGRDADLPPGTDWLTPGERVALDRLTVPKRRADWLRGRWVAKGAVARWVGLPRDAAGLGRIEVRPDPDGAPRAFVDGRHGPALSISHSGEAAVAAVAARGPLGCDLETIQPLADATVRLFFTDAERARISAEPRNPDRDRRAILVWSAKESALKALRTGLRADTRTVEVEADGPGPGGWGVLRVRNRPDGRMLRGWWRFHGDFVLTVVEPSPEDPPPDDPFPVQDG